MSPNPILKVLSLMRAHRVRALLMGGQACVFYGGAEFSRDTDLAILADAANLARLRRSNFVTFGGGTPYTSAAQRPRSPASGDARGRKSG